MGRVASIVGFMLVVIGALALSMAPDILSLAIVAIMLLAISGGFLFAMLPSAMFASGLRKGSDNIDSILEVQTAAPWLAAQQTEYLFHQRTLDRLYQTYVQRCREQEQNGLTPGDIEEIINERSLSLRSWQNVAAQIPGTLTSLGLLGTFVGLVVGISNIGFSSVDAALGSIEVLLSGIRTAFFTSIVGVIFSILFNILNKFFWNVCVRELGMFIEKFHLRILPSVEEQERQKRDRDMKLVLERLDRLPRNPGFSLTQNMQASNSTEYEQHLMPEIREGLKNGEFIFFLQPRCDINSQRIVGAEALVRWKHGDMGVVSPSAFLPLVEQNGYIVRIDQEIWECVCRTLRSWIDSGRRPVPISINVSKMDILAMDVAEVLETMVHRYHIPPRYLEIEISVNAYVQSEQAASELETQLRQRGFRVIADGFNGDFMVANLLKRCNADAIKLDMRFCQGKEAKLIDEVFSSLDKLEIEVIAVGIESAEQISVLRRHRCVEGQGNFLHRPMAVEDFEEVRSLE